MVCDGLAYKSSHHNQKLGDGKVRRIVLWFKPTSAAWRDSEAAYWALTFQTIKVGIWLGEVHKHPNNDMKLPYPDCDHGPPTSVLSSLLGSGFSGFTQISVSALETLWDWIWDYIHAKQVLYQWALPHPNEICIHLNVDSKTANSV